MRDRLACRLQCFVLDYLQRSGLAASAAAFQQETGMHEVDTGVPELGSCCCCTPCLKALSYGCGRRGGTLVLLPFTLVLRALGEALPAHSWPAAAATAVPGTKPAALHCSKRPAFAYALQLMCQGFVPHQILQRCAALWYTVVRAAALPACRTMHLTKLPSVKHCQVAHVQRCLYGGACIKVPVWWLQGHGMAGAVLNTAEQQRPADQFPSCFPAQASTLRTPHLLSRCCVFNAMKARCCIPCATVASA